MVRKAKRMLSPREEQVCERLKEGLRDREIARDLGVSEHTVNAHLRKIFEKFGVHSRTAAALIYLRSKAKRK
jgi:DNA-binding CsgD family transcriptional regulator